MVNKHSLEKYLISFFILNKNLLLKSKKLITVGLKIINIRIKQAGESLALILRIYL